ncbi:hypothetical protein DXG01_007835 [Tephrocybe rancida]|nr:hypothetical protein DXG01_007835 [Tephrocybe rancida]
MAIEIVETPIQIAKASRPAASSLDDCELRKLEHPIANTHYCEAREFLADFDIEPHATGYRRFEWLAPGYASRLEDSIPADPLPLPLLQLKPDTLFSKVPDYTGNPEKIAHYVKWVLQKDGPMLYGVPAPFRELGQPDPIKSPAKDCLQLQFVLDFVTPLVKYIRGSHGAFGEPKGAFALAAAALSPSFEHAFPLCKTGVAEKAKSKFGGDDIRAVVNDFYMMNCEKFSDNRWIRLKKACGLVEVVEETKKLEAAQPLRGQRRTMYIAGSTSS